MPLYQTGFVLIIFCVTIQATSWIAPTYQYRNKELAEDCCDAEEKLCDESGWSVVLGYETRDNKASCTAYKSSECRLAESCRRTNSPDCLSAIEKIDGCSCGYCGNLPNTAWCCTLGAQRFEMWNDTCRMAEFQCLRNMQCLEGRCNMQGPPYAPPLQPSPQPQIYPPVVLPAPYPSGPIYTTPPAYPNPQQQQTYPPGYTIAPYPMPPSPQPVYTTPTPQQPPAQPGYPTLPPKPQPPYVPSNPSPNTPTYSSPPPSLPPYIPPTYNPPTYNSPVTSPPPPSPDPNPGDSLYSTIYYG